MSLRHFVAAEPKRKANASGWQGSSKRPRPSKNFFQACTDGDLEAVQWYLVRYPGPYFKINQVNWDGGTPLYAACQNGHLDVVKALLSRYGIDVNKANMWGFTPLYVACLEGHSKVVKESLVNILVNKIQKQINIFCNTYVF